MAQDNVDVVQGAWDAFGRGDIEAVLDAIAPAAETRVPEALPWGGTYAGPDGFRDFLARLDENFEQFTRHSRQGARRRRQPRHRARQDQGTHQGRAARSRHRAVWIYQLRDGKIADAETFGDTAQAPRGARLSPERPARHGAP